MSKLETQEIERNLILELNERLMEIENEKLPTKFAYFVGRNLGLLAPEIKAFDKAMQPSESMTIYDKARMVLAEKHAEKDAKGKPIIIENESKNLRQYDIRDITLFESELEIMKSDHAEAFTEYEKKLKDVEEMKLEKTSIPLYKINQQYLPDAIKPVLLKLLISANLIVEDE